MNQNGRSMIEMLGVLAIIGVLSVGGIAGYSKAMSKYRTNKTIEQITQISTGIRTLYSGQRSYDGVSGTVLRKAKILPESAFDGSGSSSSVAVNPFGGNITVAVRGKYSSSDKKAFYIQITNVPDDACVELLSQEWGDATSLISYGIGNNATSFGSANSCSDSGSLRCGKNGVMEMGTVISACDGNNNTLTWSFY
ncbi:MAG: hypothetical protein IJ852_04275 [Alphaproteobacteria bacterium]|nr:hypothetical protein [Alphaproteobacteria bacterium]